MHGEHGRADGQRRRGHTRIRIGCIGWIRGCGVVGGSYGGIAQRGRIDGRSEVSGHYFHRQRRGRGGQFALSQGGQGVDVAVASQVFAAGNHPAARRNCFVDTQPVAGRRAAGHDDGRHLDIRAAHLAHDVKAQAGAGAHVERRHSQFADCLGRLSRGCGGCAAGGPIDSGPENGLQIEVADCCAGDAAGAGLVDERIVAAGLGAM